MRHGSTSGLLFILFIMSGCISQKESQLVFGNATQTTNQSSNITASNVAIEPLLMDKMQLGQHLQAIFAPVVPGDATNVSLHVKNVTFYHRFNYETTLEGSCDPYVVAVGDLTMTSSSLFNANYFCGDGIGGDNPYASKPVAKNNVYTRMAKIRQCEVLVAGGVPGSNPQFGQYQFYGAQNLPTTVLSLAFHKIHRAPADVFSPTFIPPFTHDNIILAIKAFYPTMDNLDEAATAFEKLNGVYSNAQTLDKWKVVFAGTCESMFWEMI